MELTSQKRAFTFLFSAVLAAGGWAGCGGGPEGPAAVGPGGNVIRTAGGSAVSEEAHNQWREAIAMFESREAEANGWTPPACEATINKFNLANDAQGGHFTEAIYMVGVVHGRCGDDDAALAQYRRALESNENYCGARVGVALGDMRAGRAQQARQAFERAIAADNQCTAAYVNLAIIQRSNPNEVREALDNLRRALAIESNYLPAFNQMALLYYEQAAQNTQMLALAEVVCRQAQLINGNYAPIYNTWGLINMRQGNIIAALAKFERAFNLDASLFAAYMNFGELTLSYRGYDDAARAFTRARELRSDDYDAVVGLGAAQRGLGNMDEAEATYRAAIAMDAQRPEAYYNLGLLYQDYKGGAPPALRQATQFYTQFTQRAGSNTVFAETVEAVTRRCRRRPQTSTHGRRRQRSGQSEWVGTCRPGRVQQIEENIRLQEEMQQIQAQFGGGGGGTPPEGGTPEGGTPEGETPEPE